MEISNSTERPCWYVLLYAEGAIRPPAFNHFKYATANYTHGIQYWWLCQIFYIWSSALAKISIAVALLRLTVDRIHRVIIWSMIVLTIAVSIMFWLVMLLNCHPISYFWNYADPSKTGTCMSETNLVKVAYVYSCLTIVCDLTLGILPIFLVWKLQMSHRTKIAVGGILSMGAM